MNFIGSQLEVTDQLSPYDWFVEQGSVCPSELQEAMRRARLHQLKIQGALD